MINNSLQENRGINSIAVMLAASAVMLFAAESKADSGLYVGGSVGQSGVELEDTGGINPLVFDESDMAWKVFGGFNFDLPVVDLGVEAGYVDFGAPSGDVLGEQIEVAADGLNAFGVIGLDIGPVGVFGKYGFISWDAEISVDNIPTSDDGSDSAYGIGAKIGLGSIDIRAEYEVFDIEDSEDVTMLSVGIVWTF